MHISCALFHTSRRHLPHKGGLRATSRQIIFFHFRFMHIMFRWFHCHKDICSTRARCNKYVSSAATPVKCNISCTQRNIISTHPVEKQGQSEKYGCEQI